MRGREMGDFVVSRPSILDSEEYMAGVSAANARKIAYMKWHEDPTARKY